MLIHRHLSGVQVLQWAEDVLDEFMKHHFVTSRNSRVDGAKPNWLLSFEILFLTWGLIFSPWFSTAMLPGCSAELPAV